MCIHMTALLFRVECANRNGLTNPACTSKKCEWNVPMAKTVVKPMKISDMKWKASKLNKGNKLMCLCSPLLFLVSYKCQSIPENSVEE